MKLLFNLEIIEGSRIKAVPSAYLHSLPREQQVTEVREFLAWAEREARDNSDLTARAEAEIGIATAREFLDRAAQHSPIITGNARERDHD